MKTTLIKIGGNLKAIVVDANEQEIEKLTRLYTSLYTNVQVTSLGEERVKTLTKDQALDRLLNGDSVYGSDKTIKFTMLPQFVTLSKSGILLDETDLIVIMHVSKGTGIETSPVYWSKVSNSAIFFPVE